ncbi:hypothetical protein D3C72_2163590 [compost metagenome]
MGEHFKRSIDLIFQNPLQIIIFLMVPGQIIMPVFLERIPFWVNWTGQTLLIKPLLEQGLKGKQNFYAP